MMTLVDWMIVLLLNGAVIGYGFYLSWGTKSSSDWFLGGRSLPWWGLGLSIFATSVDNADLVSITGHVNIDGEPGDPIVLEIDCLEDRRHLPIIRTRLAA